MKNVNFKFFFRKVKAPFLEIGKFKSIWRMVGNIIEFSRSYKRIINKVIRDKFILIFKYEIYKG